MGGLLLKRPLSDLPHASDIIRHFTPSWFTVTMGTGIVANLIGEQRSSAGACRCRRRPTGLPARPPASALRSHSRVLPIRHPRQGRGGLGLLVAYPGPLPPLLALLAARFICFPATGRALFRVPFQVRQAWCGGSQRNAPGVLEGSVGPPACTPARCRPRASPAAAPSCHSPATGDVSGCDPALHLCHHQRHAPVRRFARRVLRRRRSAAAARRCRRPTARPPLPPAHAGSWRHGGASA